MQWIDPGLTGGGHRYATIVLTNKSASDCWVSGSVGLITMAADQSPAKIPITVAPGNPGQIPGPPVKVVLKPGGSAAEGVVFDSDRNPPPGQASCAPMVTVYRVVLGWRPNILGDDGGNGSVEVPGWHMPHCPADQITMSNLTAGTTFPAF